MYPLGVVFGFDDCASVVGQEIDRACLAAFVNLNALLLGVADQDLVELGAMYLVGVGHGLVPRFAKLEYL